MTASEHVLIFTDVQPPDNVSTAHIVAALAQDLHDGGHRVTVVSTRPHSRPEGPVADRVDGPRVIRVPVPRKSRSAIRNALIWMLYLCQAWFVGMLRVRRPTVVLAVTPPPGIGLVGSWVARRHRARFIYNVKELYPDIAIALGVVTWRPAVAAVRWVEDRAFRKAEIVITSTRAMLERIGARSGDTPVMVIPDGVDTAPFAAPVDGSGFRAEFGIAAPFIVGYAGNMGQPQNLDMLLDAAALVAGEGIGVVLVGDGTERERLASRIAAEGLIGVTMVPHQPVERVPEIYAACDAMFVSLAPGMGADAMPSKAYQIMAAGRPILAAAELEATLIEVVTASQAGVAAALTPQGIAHAMRSLQTADRMAMGDRGRRFVAAGYSRRAVADAYLGLVAGAPGTHQNEPDTP